MRPAENIEKLVKNINIDTNAKIDEAVLGEVVEAFEKSKVKKTSAIEQNIWRIIMKSKITKLAAAAVIIVAVLIGLNQFSGSIDGSNVAFADMIKTMKQMPWVHLTGTYVASGENFVESWFCFESEIFASIQYREGKLLYNNDKDNSEYTYDQQEGIIYFSQVGGVNRESASLTSSSFLPEVMINHLSKEASEITRDIIFQNGEKVEIVSATMNQKSSITQIEFRRNVQQNLILSTKVDYKDATKSLVTTYDYPETGPMDIYDLGAPADAEIVYLHLSSEIQDLIEKLNSLRKTMLTKYVAISIPSGVGQLPTSFDGRRPERYFTVKDHLVSSIWRKDDERRHSMGYFSKGDVVPSAEELLENIQNSAELLVAVCSNIYKASERRIYRYQILNGKSLRTIRKGAVEDYGSTIFVEQICWPQIVVPRYRSMQWKMEHVTGSNDETLIMIERVTGNFVGRWFINPARNYICQKYEHGHSDGTPIRSTEILEYAQTQSGQWYPCRIRRTDHRRVDSEELRETTSRIIFLQENPDFPEGIFDPANLPKAND